MTDFQRAKLFLTRAMKLRCPECGVSPLFVPIKNIRSMDDWLFTLEGCPICGYPYTRENGYWLISTWVINYTIVGGLGLAVGIWADSHFAWAFWKTCLLVAISMPLVSLLINRHCKALFLAIDHWFDPHVPPEKI
jgi:uncharacterized protein (DUF983 family)